VDRLDEEGLISVHNAGRRCDIGVAHPLYAEVLAARLSPLRGRRVRAALAAAVGKAGARRREDQIRMTAWQLDSGGPVEAPALVQAARLALLRQDLVLAQDFAQRVFDELGLPEALQVLCEVHFRLADFQRVEALLSGADLRGSDDGLRAALARRRATNLFYNLGLLEEPLRVLSDALESLADPAAIRIVLSHKAMILAFGGRVREALDLTERLASVRDGPNRFELLRARTLAMVMAGRAETALRLSGEGRALHAELEGGFATPGLSVLLFWEATALAELGRIRDARDHIESTLLTRREATTRNWLRIATARLELIVGDTSAVSRAIEPVIEEARGIAPIERWGLVLLAMGCLLVGDTQAASAHLDRAGGIRADPPPSVFSYDADRAGAWLVATMGDTSTACERLIAAASRARRTEAAAMEAALLHDVVRFGGADAVARRLSNLARHMDGDLISVRAEHARAAAGSDPDGLARVAQDFDRLGSPLMAAEAAAQAGRISGRRGSRVADRDFASRLPVPPQTPALAASGSRSTLSDRELSDRELEVARLAAAGCSSSVIAERLFLSVRTVDNHLRHVYVKLGINRRAQLAEVLST
jgi:DNA-binding CsgD family transcriptional regulator